jgi:hypothetical protein
METVCLILAYVDDNWECLAKLRFNLPNLVNSLVHLTEPTAQFIFVMDYDAAVCK